MEQRKKVEEEAAGKSHLKESHHNAQRWALMGAGRWGGEELPRRARSLSTLLLLVTLLESSFLPHPVLRFHSNSSVPGNGLPVPPLFASRLACSPPLPQKQGHREQAAILQPLVCVSVDTQVNLCFLWCQNKDSSRSEVKVLRSVSITEIPVSSLLKWCCLSELSGACVF